MSANIDRVRAIEVDVGALSRRYEEERLKRIREDAPGAQYEELRRSNVLDNANPFVDPGFTRNPVVRDVDAVVIGGGFAGLLAGANMRKIGVEDVTIIDKAGDFGGTWYWNRYPGASCDVESYIYLPLLEDTGFMPSMKYSPGKEIFEYSQIIGRTFDLYHDALFQTQVTGLTWNAETKRWIVETTRGDRLAARFVVSCTGLFGEAKVPKIAGIESFEGKMFHTARWDYDYTGGHQLGDMDKLGDKKVAIIGTGATGLQAIPYLARDAQHLTVFQRTPSSVDPRGNRQTDPDWFKAQEPGWQKRRSTNFTSILSGGVEPEDLVADGWTDIMRHIPVPAGGEDLRESVSTEDISVAGLRKMEEVRQRIAATVGDEKTADALKPWYHYFCKRPGFHDDYLSVFNRDNVTLVDTAPGGVERITPHGLVAGGVEYEADCIIFATGFGWFGDFSEETGITVTGRDGRTLTEHWADGPRTLYAMQTHGFPNLFFMRVIQAGASFNFVHTAEEQTQHIAWIIGEMEKRGLTAVEPTAEAEDAWVQEVVSHSGPRLEQLKSCTPSYYNHEGKLPANIAQNELFGLGPLPYFNLLADWRHKGDLAGLQVE